MDLKAQEKVSKLMTEQAEKLGKALAALRKIAACTDDEEAKRLASETLREVALYGKDPKDL
jgi:hypothetical protein